QGGCVILCVLIHEVSGVRGVRLMERNALGYPGFARGAGRAVPRPYRGALAWGLMVLLGLTGCAGAKAPAPAEQQAGEAPPAAAQLAHAAPASFDRPPVVPPLVQPVVPPAARQAVQDAYDAAQRKRWATVDQLAPLAAADPVLGLYPRYWALRNQLQDRTQPVPDAAVRQFLADTAGTYLNERIRADWILALVRAGNYAQAVQVPAIADPASSVRCALLLARHQGGKRAHAAEVLDAFPPNDDCWDMLDQVAADHILSRKELNDLLRNTLENGKRRDADRLAGVVFDDTAMVQYAALMKNTRAWLESRKRPRAAVEFELAAIALSRLA